MNKADHRDDFSTAYNVAVQLPLISFLHGKLQEHSDTSLRAGGFTVVDDQFGRFEKFLHPSRACTFSTIFHFNDTIASSF